MFIVIWKWCSMEAKDTLPKEELEWELEVNINNWKRNVMTDHSQCEWDYNNQKIHNILALKKISTIDQNFQDCYLIEYENNSIKLLFWNTENQYCEYLYNSNDTSHSIDIQSCNYATFNQLLINQTKPNFSYHSLETLIQQFAKTNKEQSAKINPKPSKEEQRTQLIPIIYPNTSVVSQVSKACGQHQQLEQSYQERIYIEPENLKVQQEDIDKTQQEEEEKEQVNTQQKVQLAQSKQSQQKEIPTLRILLRIILIILIMQTFLSHSIKKPKQI